MLHLPTILYTLYICISISLYLYISISTYMLDYYIIPVLLKNPANATTVAVSVLVYS